MVDRQNEGAVVVTTGAACVLTGTFLPWLRSGSRDRSSYTIFELVERLGFAPGGAVSWALRLWPAVPLVLVMIAVGAWVVSTTRSGWPILATLTVVAVVWVGGTATSVVLAPDAGLFRIGLGPAVTLLGLVVVVAGLIWLRPPGSGASATS